MTNRVWKRLEYLLISSSEHEEYDEGSQWRDHHLIDEFGTGTEPGIGGAIAEAVLDKFCKQKLMV